MTIKDLQQWVEEDWEKRSVHRPDVELQLLYILEELGEVAEAIRKSKGMKDRKKSEVHIGSEIADLLIAVTTIANHFDVDIDAEMRRFKARMVARHDQGY